MLTGVRGSLLSGQFLEEELARAFAGELGEAAREASARALRRWWMRQSLALGPASPLRSVLDLAALPLAEALGFRPRDVCVSSDRALGSAQLQIPSGRAVAFLVTAWGADLDTMWRTAVRLGASQDAAWCLCFNARALRLVDARHTYARRYVEFDLEATVACPAVFTAFWGLLRAEAFAPPRPPPSRAAPAGPCLPLVTRAVDASARRAVGVCAALREGVLKALAELVQGLAAAGVRSESTALAAGEIDQVLEQALTVVYRILFLLYAEARNLVPVWHRVYRESYAVETLRSLVEQSRPPAGIWETLQAMSRLSHAGCRAGRLRVTPFNGRLFSPDATPLAETRVVDDGAVRRAILALSSEPGKNGSGRLRISFRDLGVEELGAIYENVLDYEPRIDAAPADGTPASATAAPSFSSALDPDRHASRSRRPPLIVGLVRGSGRRKATGTFYTPRPITEYLVRSVLDPLVASASAEAILQLRVLDPAMGSGAFLVAACRHLASAYEAALVREGTRQAGDIDEADRAGYRRAVAQRCLFGVDLNPMAVQLARVSLWLTTLAADKPLTFLDHHLRVGDSLAGASLDDLLRRPPGRSRRSRSIPRRAHLPLFDSSDLEETLRSVLPARQRIEREPGDSLTRIRSKEAALAALDQPGSVLSSWKAVADLWCACWFWDAPPEVPDERAFSDLASRLRGAGGSLPASAARVWCDAARAVAQRRRFFHWTLEFPEVFFEADGRVLANPGFDAIVGNPPWDMVRADRGSAPDAGRDTTRAVVRQMTAFARESGVYTLSGDGHLNLYQLFVERALRLARQGGRVGLVLPWGLASDHGSAGLRRYLFERADTDTLVGFENTAGVFPVHRSLRFLALTSTKGGRTERVRCRFGERDPQALDAVPYDPETAAPAHYPVTLTPAFLHRLSGDDLAIPDIRRPAELALVERLSARFPCLASPDGWGVEFSRELNATEDRQHFTRGAAGLPVVDGKHVDPFRVRTDMCGFRIPEDAAAQIVDPDRTFRRARLAYRDVAGAGNRLTVIAAIVPRGCLTTHTLFCLRTPVAGRELAFLCGLLNSYAVNFLARQRVTTHVSAGIIGRIPAPRPEAHSAALHEAAALSVALAASSDPERHDAYSRLQALIAALYELTPAEFSLVLESFPLVDAATREAARRAFSRLSP